MVGDQRNLNALGEVTPTPTRFAAAGPAWVYTLTVDWDTDSQYTLSHISLLMDVEGGTCSCDDFYTAPIDEDILSLVDKLGQNSCFGYLSGYFPGMPCDPVAAENTSYCSVKGLSR